VARPRVCGCTTRIRVARAWARSLRVTYLDPSGFIEGNSITTLVIPALGTATVFLGADSRLPDFFTGTAIILSDQPLIGIGNVVDYGVRTRDGSWAYNLVNQRGFTS